MPRSINTKEEKKAFIQIWKYLSANGKLFIPVLDVNDSSEVYAEEDVDLKTKTIRAFMDSQAMELYLHEQSNKTTPLEGTLKVGITPVKLLQTKLTQIYGINSTDGITVECLLTSYDELGNMRNIDTIWTQLSN